MLTVKHRPKTRRRGNMYRFVSKTWNPLAGECSHKCAYCSTKSLKRFPLIAEKYSGPPRLYEPAMKENLGSGRTIFVVSQNDLFADNVPYDIILAVLEKCREHDNTYYFQTKNPKKFLSFLIRYRKCIPLKSVFCCTMESSKQHYEFMGNTSAPKVRASFVREIADYVPVHITVEPIMDFNPDFSAVIRMCNPTQVNIGADSKHHRLPEPSREKIIQLIKELEAFTKVHIKSNLKRILK